MPLAQYLRKNDVNCESSLPFNGIESVKKYVELIRNGLFDSLNDAGNVYSVLILILFRLLSIGPSDPDFLSVFSANVHGVRSNMANMDLIRGSQGSQYVGAA